MTTFSGFGPGKRADWKSRRYHSDGSVSDDSAPKRKRGPAVHTSFKPFVSHQVHGDAAKALGLPRTKTRGTAFTSERQLREYLAHEKRAGRDVGWKDT